MSLKTNLIFLAVLIALVINIYPVTEIEKAKTIKRFIFAIGANDGGADRVKLQYAQSDAISVVKVMQKMGGILAEDSILLNQPDQEMIKDKMFELGKRVELAKKKHSRVEVIFYYSGHSDKESLYLKGKKFHYSKYRDLMNKIDSQVKITILDSCSSGTFTRFKGLKPRPPFLLDNKNNMEGFAIITSCSSEEASQESDYLKGSFFTHNLIAGLRGAADVIPDGKVTLNEAYQYAFNQTLVKTDKTIGGTQHPHYNIQMSGTGDVVMTDIRKSSGIINFDQNIFGKLMVWDEKDLLVIEIKKIKGKILKLGLDKGRYRIVNIFNGKIYESNVAIRKNKTFFIVHQDFKKSKLEKTRSRGTEIAVFERVKKQSKFFPFFSLKAQSRKIIGENGAGPIIYLGVTQQRGFSISLFGMVGGQRGYGGVSFKYAFFRNKPIHFEIGAQISLFTANIPLKFSTLETEVQLVYKINKKMRIGAGIAIPFKNDNYIDVEPNGNYIVGSDMPSLFLSFRFGK